MSAKSIIEYLHARAVAGKWSRHVSLAPVAMALMVAVLPFTLQPDFERPLESLDSVAPGAAPTAEQSPFSGLVLASVSTAPKRVAAPLNAQQRTVANYIVSKYGVSAEGVQDFVRTAFVAGKQYGVDPLLVVAVMAVESSYNPFAESWAGAKGLMQIIPKYHREKFVEFGGEATVFDPRVNILVGARILREYLTLASGDLLTALQTYAGALADSESIYTQRVLDEKDRLHILLGVPKTARVERNAPPGETAKLAQPPLAPVPAQEPVMLIPITPAVPPAPEAAVTPAAPVLRADDAAQPKPPSAPLNLTQATPEVVRFWEAL